MPRMIRIAYSFRRPLEDAEAALLFQLINWRGRSRVIRDHAGVVVGCICHPDDLSAFEERLGQKIVLKKVAVGTCGVDSLMLARKR